LPEWHILYQQVSACIGAGPPARTTPTANTPDLAMDAHHHATQLVDLPINTHRIAMPCASWSYRLAILQHGSNMRAHSCFPGTKIE
jgi:hypothetical protein